MSRVFLISNLRSTDADEAYVFHKAVTGRDSHIWPRTNEQIKQLANNGCLFAAREGRSGEIVALCYATLDGEVWEIGGLTVDPSVQKLGIGIMLARLALSHTFVYEQPHLNGQTVISHVHEDNAAPLRLLEHLGFKETGQVELPGDQAPASMKRNSKGMVVGKVFTFTNDGVRNLAIWFKDFNGMIADGVAAEVDLGPAKLSDLVIALKEIAATLKD